MKPTSALERGVHCRRRCCEVQCSCSSPCPTGSRQAAPTPHRPPPPPQKKQEAASWALGWACFVSQPREKAACGEDAGSKLLFTERLKCGLSTQVRSIPVWRGKRSSPNPENHHHHCSPTHRQYKPPVCQRPLSKAGFITTHDAPYTSSAACSRDLYSLPNTLHRSSTWSTRSSNHRFSPSTHFPFLYSRVKLRAHHPFLSNTELPQSWTWAEVQEASRWGSGVSVKRPTPWPPSLAPLLLLFSH